MNGRQTVGGRRPVKNMELWKELDEVALHHIGSGLRGCPETGKRL